jgi:hypothetical protein
LGWNRVAVCEGRVEAGASWSRWTEQRIEVASRAKRVAGGTERKKLFGGRRRNADRAEAREEFMLNLDVVNGIISFVELLDRPEITESW